MISSCAIRLFLLAVLLVAPAILVAGCDGPTKRGMEVRTEARDRLALVNAQVHYEQANRAFEVGQLDKAMQEINLAIARYEASPDYHLLKGRIFLETHRLEHAVDSFQRTISLLEERNAEGSRDRGTGQPRNSDLLAQAHYFAGIVYQRWSNAQRAYEHYMSAMEASEGDSTSVHYLLAAAESMIEMNELDSAESLILARLSYFEHNAALRQLLGHIALLRDDPNTALIHLAEARMLNPDDAMLLEELSWALHFAGRHAQCYDALQDLAALVPSSQERFDLQLLRARSLTLMGRPREARSLYLEISRHHPNEPQVWIELGALAWEIQDYQRVTISGTRTISLAPERFEGYLLRSLAAREQGEMEQAVQFVRQAAERAPGDTLPHLILGRTLEENGQLEDALEAYGNALMIDPNDQHASSMFARLSEQKQLTTVPVN